MFDDCLGLPVCPFFLKDNNGKIYCEGGIVKPPDRNTKNEILYKHCTNMDNHKNCTIYQMLSDYYSRKYDTRKE